MEKIELLINKLPKKHKKTLALILEELETGEDGCKLSPFYAYEYADTISKRINKIKIL